MFHSFREKIICPIAAVLIYTTGYSQPAPGFKANAPGAILTNQDVTRLVDSMQARISQQYYDKKLASAINKVLGSRLAQHKYDNLQPDSLVKLINTDLKTISRDGHLYIQTFTASEKSTGFDWSTYEKEQEARLNYGFTKLEILDGNIGYIKIVEFMHPKRSMQTAIAAMKMVENTGGLIIDIRGNGGGYPGIMEYIMNHYFEGEPIELSRTLYAKDNYATTYSSDLIHGKLRTNTPLCILIDNRTASAAEYFAYTLQAYKKAFVIGEKSAGGANRNEYVSLPNGFRMSLSVASPVISVTGSNWEGAGVIPDIESRDALQTAYEKMKFTISNTLNNPNQ
jgi:hypothetical protein